MLKLKIFLLFSLAFFSSYIFALGTNESCDTAPEHKTITGSPLLLQKSRYYGRSNCYRGYLIDYNYPNAHPGTYISWSDTLPSDSGKCDRARVRVYLWDVTNGQSTYRGSKSVKGKWIDNPDPKRINGRKVCSMAALRVDDIYHLRSNKKYRLGIRAEQRWASGGYSRRQFAVAPAPIPNYGGLAKSTTDGIYVTIPAANSVQTSSQADLISGFRFALNGSRRVDTGGDISFYDTNFGPKFIHPAGLFQRDDSVNYGISNTSFLDQDQRPYLNFYCPRLIQTSLREYNYNIGRNSYNPPMTEGKGYCILNEDNSEVYSARVDKSSSDLLVLQYSPQFTTDKKTYGCLDGLCTSKDKLVVINGEDTSYEKNTFIPEAFSQLGEMRQCVENHLNISLPGGYKMKVHANKFDPSPSGSISYGTGSLYVPGFQGIIQPGNYRVTDVSDLKFNIYGVFQFINSKYFKTKIPSWLNAGLAIQTTNITCNNSPNYIAESWRYYTPGTSSPHQIGSEFFKRLYNNYSCGPTCVSAIWNNLVSAHGNDTNLTNSEIKTVFENHLNTNLTNLFNDLSISY